MKNTARWRAGSMAAAITMSLLATMAPALASPTPDDTATVSSTATPTTDPATATSSPTQEPPAATEAAPAKTQDPAPATTTTPPSDEAIPSPEAEAKESSSPRRTTESRVSAAADPVTTPGDGAPGELRTYVDPNGNVFNYRIVRQSTGTGHGTTSACFINDDVHGGYTPGDNTPEDDYACLGDTYSYRIEWSADVTNGSMQVVLVASTGTWQANGWPQWTGEAGGPDLPFTGTGTGSTRTITFKEGSGVSSGFFTITGKVDAQNYGLFDGAVGPHEASVTLRRPGSTATVTRGFGDKPTTMIAQIPWDSLIALPYTDTFNTVHDDTRYIGMGAQALAQQIYSPTVLDPSLLPPGYSSTKGLYGGAAVDLDSAPARWTFLGATASSTPLPEGTPVLFTINGGDPVRPTGTDENGNPYLIAPKMSDTVKVLLPWDDLPSTSPGGQAAQYIFNYRLDPVGQVLDRLGQPVTNGLTDPGIGLSCSTSTAGIYNKATAGKYAPNNNCATLSFEKRSYDNVPNDKTHRSQSVTFEGQTYNPAVGPDTGTAHTLGSNAVTVVLTVNPTLSPSTEDFMFCDVWEPGMERFFSGSPDLSFARYGQEGTRTSLEKFYPGATLWFTDQDLTPQYDGQAPKCGHPGDGTSGWTQDRASIDENDISGFLVVMPGQDTLREPFQVYSSRKGTKTENYDQLVTTPVTNHFGFNNNGTEPGAAPWQFGDFSSMTVIGAEAYVSRLWGGVNTPAGPGANRLTFTSSGDIRRSADFEATGTYRVYPDKCLTDIQITSPANAVYVPVPEDDDGKCGPGNSYIEVTIPLDQDFKEVVWSALTPVWTAGDDQFTNRMSAVLPTDTGEFWASRPTSEATFTLTVPSAAVVTAGKSVLDPSVEIEDPFRHALTMLNFTDRDLGRAQWIDVLPYDGDANGSDFTGTYELDSVIYTGRPGVPNATEIEYTSAAPTTINSDPSHASNAAGGTTVWCAEEDFGTAGCPEDIGDTTGLRLTISDFAAGMSQAFTLTFDPEGNSEGDIYANRLSIGRVAGLGEPLPSPQAVRTSVYASSLAGQVFYDADRGADQDESERLLEGYTVILLDADGNEVARTTSDADGNYLFDDLKAGDYSVQVVNDQGEFIEITLAGGQTYEEALDGITEVITVGADEDVTDVDFGLWAGLPISIVKVDEAGTPLAGASFTLYQEGADGELVAVEDGLVASEDGTIFSAEGLMPGADYWLIEEETAEGRNLLAQPVRLRLTADGAAIVSGGSGLIRVDADDPFRLVVGNTSAVSLPNAGDVGSPAAPLAALVLLLLAGAYLQNRRPRNSPRTANPGVAR